MGLVLLVALLICARNFGRFGSPSFLAPLAVAGVAYLLAIREFFATPKLPKHVMVVGLALAAVWQCVFLLKPPGPDDDIHRYVWDGRVQRLGYNPYIVIPSDPALAKLHTDETRTLNHPDLPSPYPAGAELFFRTFTAIHESVFALKVAFLLCAWGIVFVLLDLLRRSGEAAHWVLAYAWQPLLAIEVAGSGHIDIVGALLLIVSAAALARRWGALAALTFALAVSVKFLPIVLLPLYWKRVRWRDAILGIIVFILMYVPFLNHGHISTGSLGAYVINFRFNGPVFAAVERLTSLQGAAGWAVLIGFLVAVWMRARSLESTAKAIAWPMAASLLCAPVIYPWYLLWLVPFLRSASAVPIIVWTVSIVPAYYVWYLRALGQPWLVPGWALLIEYGSVVAAAVWIGLRALRRQSATRSSAKHSQ